MSPLQDAQLGTAADWLCTNMDPSLGTRFCLRWDCSLAVQVHVSHRIVFLIGTSSTDPAGLKMT
jgi:hypothetical protein